LRPASAYSTGQSALTLAGGLFDQTQVLTLVEFPLGYVHGVNEVLSPQGAELEGKSAGKIIEVPIDGNNPLCGRAVIFKLEILLVRDATEEEIAAGGKVEAGPDIETGPGIHEVLK